MARPRTASGRSSSHVRWRASTGASSRSAAGRRASAAATTSGRCPGPGSRTTRTRSPGARRSGPRIATTLRERDHSPSELRELLAKEPLEALALALALRAPSEAVLHWVTDLRGVGLEISGADLVAAGVPEGPAIGRALEETLRRKLDGLVSGRDDELETALLLAREPAQ